MPNFKIGDRLVGQDAPCYIIAEVSCNHNGDFNEACKIIEAAGKAGADATFSCVTSPACEAFDRSHVALP